MNFHFQCKILNKLHSCIPVLPKHLKSVLDVTIKVTITFGNFILNNRVASFPLWTLDLGFWTLNSGLYNLDSRLWTTEHECRVLSSLVLCAPSLPGCGAQASFPVWRNALAVHRCCAVLCCTVQYTVLYCAVLYGTVYCTVLCCAVGTVCCTVLCSAVRYSVIAVQCSSLE